LHHFLPSSHLCFINRACQERVRIDAAEAHLDEHRLVAAARANPLLASKRISSPLGMPLIGGGGSDRSNNGGSGGGNDQVRTRVWSEMQSGISQAVDNEADMPNHRAFSTVEYHR
jgi:hypothetical protein